jgi:ATP-dependent Clp protease protease subunit
MSELAMLEVSFPEANLQLPSPELATFFKNANDRIFWIDQEITDNVFEIIKRIIQINKEDKDKKIEEIVPVRIFVNSPGGDLEATLSFVNICEISRTPIYTYNMGIAMSGGLLILLAGHKRFCLDCSRAMYHIGSGSNTPSKLGV